MSKYRNFFFIFILFLSFSFDIAAAEEEVLAWHDCIKEAAKNNPNIIAAVDQITQSVASKDITASGIYPQINSNLGASTARGASGAVADSYNYGVSGTQLIFDGAKTLNNINAAQENITASKENFRFTSASTRYNLRSAFVKLLKAQEMLRITKEIYDIRRSNLELITLRYESGLEHKGALMTSQADLSGAEYGIRQAIREFEVAQRELIKEMGRAQLTPIAVKGDFQVRDAAKDKPDFTVLAKDNPELQQAIAKKNSAEFSLKSAYADFFPSVSGQAGASKSGNRWEPKGDQWNLGLTVSLPIFEGGLRFAQVSKAKALLDQLKENQRNINDTVVVTLEQAWATLQDTMDNVKVQREKLDANQMRSDIAQAQYSLGIMTFDNWIIIEDNLVTSKKAYITAEADALLAEANWIKAKGETLEYE